MPNENSIDISALSEEIRKTVALIKGEPRITFLPNPGIIGFIAPIEDLQDKDLGALSTLAGKIGETAGPFIGATHFIVRDDHVTIGFMVKPQT